MASYSVIMMPTAENDLEEACAYYDEQKPGLGIVFLKAYDDAKTKMAEHPERYGYYKAKPLLRFILLRKFPYKVIFEISDATVFIYTVRRHSRMPFV